MYFQPALWLLIVQYPQTDRNKEELGASPPPAVQQGSVYQGKPKTSSDFAIGITVISFNEEEISGYHGGCLAPGWLIGRCVLYPACHYFFCQRGSAEGRSRC